MQAISSPLGHRIITTTVEGEVSLWRIRGGEHRTRHLAPAPCPPHSTRLRQQRRAMDCDGGSGPRSYLECARWFLPSQTPLMPPLTHDSRIRAAPLGWHQREAERVAWNGEVFAANWHLKRVDQTSTSTQNSWSTWVRSRGFLIRQANCSKTLLDLTIHYNCALADWLTWGDRWADRLVHILHGTSTPEFPTRTTTRDGEKIATYVVHYRHGHHLGITRLARGKSSRALRRGRIRECSHKGYQ